MVSILLIGNGAREHVLADALKRSVHDPDIHSYMRSNNPGISNLSKTIKIGSYDDLESIRSYANETQADFAVIGPEAPLAEGVVDALLSVGVQCVGPTKDLARLETSKSFARELMQKHNIPGLPSFRSFPSKEGIRDFIKSLDQVVVKPDGLTGGKGVMVQGDHFKNKDEAVDIAESLIENGSAVIVEEKLYGEEFSLQSFCDGKSLFHCPPVQDHKRAYDQDKGPNTGGMGSYSTGSLLPFMTEKDLDDAKSITKKVADAIRTEMGVGYKGVMYGGFIITKTGVKLIEYNARMGDPEVMNVMPLMENDFVDVCRAIIGGTLDKLSPRFSSKSTVCKYVVPKGYPDDPVTGEKIDLSRVPPGASVYYSSVDQKEDGLFMSSSRAVAFVGIADDLSSAEKIAQSAVESVIGQVFFRKDIGTAVLVQKRIEHMKQIRGQS